MLNQNTRNQQKENIFNDEVAVRFDLYNSLFLTLPFHRVKDTGILLPFFATHCDEGLKENKTPKEIIESFFEKHKDLIADRNIIDILFRFIQYIERQVVLYDAVEDAAFNTLNPDNSSGTLTSLINQLQNKPGKSEKITQYLKQFTLRLVLTAHPTQFYPGTVLGIINDLTDALKHNDINQINGLLQQLGKTPFFQKKKPTPKDEAISLAWYLEHIFYHTAANAQLTLENIFEDSNHDIGKVVELGFWPGGDRDGNPFVNVQTTKDVSLLLRQILFRCYYREFRELKRRITFDGLEENINKLQDLFYAQAYHEDVERTDISKELISLLDELKVIVLRDHNGLFLNNIKSLLSKVKLYGCYFASLDIRQDSGILQQSFIAMACKINHNFNEKTYVDLNEEDKINQITSQTALVNPSTADDELVVDTIDTIKYIAEMQKQGGEMACHRFIISNTQHASDILQLMQMFLWNGWKKETLSIDFTPLFETIDDLKNAEGIMQQLYENEFYQQHLKNRKNKQTIMLGYSDSTKDGGYLRANWSIYEAKVALTSQARQYGLDLSFFDGRGGPPARGGGKTHRFYASLGKEIANDHIQITVQGQTVSSQYGSFYSAKFNMEQLLNAGLNSKITKKTNELTVEQKDIIKQMAQISHEKFMALREDPLFLPYLEKLSPLKLLSQINISSRPVKRKAEGPLKLSDLRAISFVTAWSQLKQNVPGFYGVGSAFKAIKESGRWDEVKELYTHSGYFKTLIDNCMMSMSKSDFRITSYLNNDRTFGNFYTQLKTEYDLAKEMLLALTGNETLMAHYPVEQKSIALRERIVQPLIMIQHYALQMLNNEQANVEEERYKKLVIRTVYGIINAARNSV